MGLRPPAELMEGRQLVGRTMVEHRRPMVTEPQRHQQATAVLLLLLLQPQRHSAVSQRSVKPFSHTVFLLAVSRLQKDEEQVPARRARGTGYTRHRW